MRLSGIGANSSLLNTAAINQKVNRGNPDNTPQAGPLIQPGNRDSLFISGQGKKESIIQQLMNQKQLIQESKNAEMKRGLEDGYVNQDKIDEYDEQLEMIDKQIAEATAKQAEDEGEEGTRVPGRDQEMTREEYDQRRMADLMDLSSGMTQAEIISSTKTKLDGEARVLKAEIKSDGGNASESKLDRLAKIEAKSSDLLAQAGDTIAKADPSDRASADIVPAEEEAGEEDPEF